MGVHFATARGKISTRKQTELSAEKPREELCWSDACLEDPHTALLSFRNLPELQGMLSIP